jgi:diadenosine tetraphosphatase ApaH/serine/threonine PP2A family protein phosphatase
MRVSQFEIHRLIQRAMEALGAGYGVDRDAARCIAWLEARGLPGLTVFDRELAALELGLPAARLQAQSEAGTIIDLGGSAIACAGAVVDLALAKFRQSAGARIRLRGCTTPLFLIPALAEAALPAASLDWLADGGEVSVTAGGGEATVLLPPDMSLNEALAIPQGDTLLVVPAAPPPPGLVNALSPIQLADRLNWVLSRGIDVDPALWRRLDAVAARVQVPASEASRERGAGGGDANT